VQVEFPYFVSMEIKGENVQVSTLQDSKNPFMLSKSSSVFWGRFRITYRWLRSANPPSPCFSLPT
jgi:hypothetical protein